MKLKPKFYLNIESSSSAAVWPFTSREHPEIDKRIQENYYSDEDFSSTGFDIADMEDLLRIVKFYEGSGVRMTLGVITKMPELEVNAYLGDKHHGGPGFTFRSLESESLSPRTAASKLDAISSALMRWDHEQSKANNPKA